MARTRFQPRPAPRSADRRARRGPCPVEGLLPSTGIYLISRRSSITNNVVDFEILRRRAVAEGREVPGLIYTSDNRFPRRRAFVAQLADALEHAARSHHVEAEGAVLWLGPPDGYDLGPALTQT